MVLTINEVLAFKPKYFGDATVYNVNIVTSYRWS